MIQVVGQIRVAMAMVFRMEPKTEVRMEAMVIMTVTRTAVNQEADSGKTENTAKDAEDLPEDGSDSSLK